MELTRMCVAPEKDSEEFIFRRGITFRSTFTFNDADDSPLSLSSIIVTFHLLEKSNTTPTEIILASDEGANSNGSSITVTDAINGEAELLITDEETSDMDYDDAYWWITLTLSNGDVVSRGKGTVEIKEPYE